MTMAKDNTFQEKCEKCGKIETGINTHIHYHRICKKCKQLQDKDDT